MDMILFHGISTINGYFIPSPVYSYILDIWFVKHFIYTQLNDQTILFLTIQFSISQKSWIFPRIDMYYWQFN